MKSRHCPDLSTIPPSLRLALALACSSSASFALDWDPDPTAGIQPGSGDWDTATANWTADGGATNVVWVDNQPSVFSGADGSYTITLPASISFVNGGSGGLTFNHSGNTFQGSGAVRDINTKNGKVILGAGTINTIGFNTRLRTNSFRFGQVPGVASGTLNIASGGGFLVNGTADLFMDGLGTTLNLSDKLDTANGQLNLGDNKTAPSPGTPITDVTINVKSGGSIDADVDPTQIGWANSGNTDPSDVTGTIVIESGGSALFDEVRVGQFGTGFLDIQDGATVSAGRILLGNGGPAVGHFNLEGLLSANSIYVNKPNSVANFDGGTLTARAVDPLGLIYGGGGTVNIRNGGLNINTNGFDVVINRSLTHSSISGDNALDGGLIKVGDGKLTLAEDNTYTGFTDILEGSIEVGNGGTTGTITAGPQNEGTLIYNRSDDVEITADILGTGNLSQVGAGKLTLKAVSSSGDTTVTNGILELDDGDALADSSRLTIEGSGSVQLTTSETVDTLFFGIAPQVAGDWGSPTSSAPNKDARFSGTGILTVQSGAVATVQVWDTDTAPGFQPLSGNWNTTEAFWSGDGVNLAVWDPALPTIFGGVDTTATITVTEDLAPGEIEFRKSGFTLAGDDPARKLTLGAPQLTLGDGTSNSIGSDLTLTRVNPLRIGQTAGNASGSLAILPGATVETMGDEVTPAGGDLNIEGVNTAVSVSGTLQVSSGLGRINLGSNQPAGTDVSLTIESGGQVLTETDEAGSASNNVLQVGLAASSIADPANVKGTLNVMGGGLLRIGTTADRIIRLGQFGTGTLNIEEGGLVQCANVALGNGGNGTGFLNLRGTIETDSLNLAKMNSRANFDGGTIKAVGSDPDLIKGPNNSTTGLTNVRNGGLTVDTNGTDKTIAKPLRHSTIADDAAIDGGLTKIGMGKLSLTQGNTYTGPTTVSVGTLELNNGNAIPDTNSLVIATGAFVELTQDETVDSLFFGASPQSPGTYGATGSTATNIDDTRFAGTGILTVLTEGSNASAFDTWALASGLDGTSGKENGPLDDPDSDGADNFTEFAFNGDPLNSSNNGLYAALVQDASLPAGDELTLIVAVRDGASFVSSGTTPEVVQTAEVDGVAYTIEGTLDLNTIPGSDVAFASGPSDTAPAATDLPNLAGTDWEYQTFKLVASENLAAAKGFMRAKATEAP